LKRDRNSYHFAAYAPRRGNCIAFALRRFRDRGGYLVARKSHWGWWWHVLWSADLIHFQEFVPVVPSHKQSWPPLWFEGYVRHTTAPDQQELNAAAAARRLA